MKKDTYPAWMRPEDIKEQEAIEALLDSEIKRKMISEFGLDPAKVDAFLKRCAEDRQSQSGSSDSPD